MAMRSKQTKILLFVFIGCQFSFAQTVSKKEADATERRQIAIAMEQSLQHDLLDIYYPRSLDTVYGGFLSTFTYDFQTNGQPGENDCYTEPPHLDKFKSRITIP